MLGDVKSPRPYDSSRRKAQARSARRKVLQAAHAAFMEHGFAGATMPAIAAAAGVSVQTVYKMFGNKGGLAKAVFDVAMAGDDEPVAMIDRPSLGAVRSEPDPRKKMALYGAFIAEVAPRHAPVQLIIRDAAAVDAEARTLWAELQTERLTGMTNFARALFEEGHLRPGMSAEEARDILWTCNSAEVFQLLVIERGWSPARYGEWVGEALSAALLR